MKTFAIIPAGGQGKRCGISLPKQYHKVKGKEIIAHTLDIFQKSDLIDEIVIAAQTEYFDLIRDIAQKYDFCKIKEIVTGGKERQDSVYNALSSLSAGKDDLIIIHDAARPLLSQKILNEAVTTAKSFDNVLVCINARDTLVKTDNEYVASYLDRNEVCYAQTPQIFKYQVIKESLETAYKQGFYGTDESMLVTRAGFKVKIVEGSVLNFKITTGSDIELFEKLSEVPDLLA